MTRPGSVAPFILKNDTGVRTVKFRVVKQHLLQQHTENLQDIPTNIKRLLINTTNVN
jgi:hypothetical protein